MNEEILSEELGIPLSVIKYHKKDILQQFICPNERVDFFVTALEIEYPKYHDGDLINMPYSEMCEKAAIILGKKLTS